MIRDDTGREVFDQRLASFRLHYAFSRDVWLRGRLDYDSLDGRMFHQAVFAWTPRPGRGFYLGSAPPPVPHRPSGTWRASSRAPAPSVAILARSAPTSSAGP